jgi:hypothetical protein
MPPSWLVHPSSLGWKQSPARLRACGSSDVAGMEQPGSRWDGTNRFPDPESLGTSILLGPGASLNNIDDVEDVTRPMHSMLRGADLARTYTPKSVDYLLLESAPER